MVQFLISLVKLSLQGVAIILFVFLVRWGMEKLRVSHKYIVTLWMIVFFFLVFPWKIAVPHGVWNNSAVEQKISESVEYLGRDRTMAQNGAAGTDKETDKKVDRETDKETGKGTDKGTDQPADGWMASETEQNPDVSPDSDSAGLVSADAQKGTNDGKLTEINKSPDGVKPGIETGENGGSKENGGNGAFSWSTFLCILWCIGTVFLSGYSLFSYVRMKQRLAICIPAAESGVYYAQDISVPMAFGVIRPGIYLPMGLDQKQISYILAHEKMHIRHRDPLRKMAAYLVCVFHWFNPFVWLAFRAFSADLEKACDEDTVETLGRESKKEYSEALLAISLAQNAAAKRTFVAPICFDEGDVTGRIKNLSVYKKMAGRMVLPVMIVCVLIFVGCLTKTKTEDPQIQLRVGEDFAVYLDEDGKLHVLFDDGGHMNRIDPEKKYLSLGEERSTLVAVDEQGKVHTSYPKTAQELEEEISEAIRDAFLAGGNYGLGGQDPNMLREMEQLTGVQQIVTSHARDFRALLEDGTVVEYQAHLKLSVLPDFSDIRQIAVKDADTVVGMDEEGKLFFSPKPNGITQFDTEKWSDLKQICSGSFLVGLKKNGTVVAEESNLHTMIAVRERWNSVKSISAANGTVIGLKEDGTVLAACAFGEDKGQCDVAGWTDIVAVDTNGTLTVGMKRDGTVVYAGTKKESIPDETTGNSDKQDNFVTDPTKEVEPLEPSQTEMQGYREYIPIEGFALYLSEDASDNTLILKKDGKTVFSMVAEYNLSFGEPMFFISEQDSVLFSFALPEQRCETVSLVAGQEICGTRYDVQYSKTNSEISVCPASDRTIPKKLSFVSAERAEDGHLILHVSVSFYADTYEYPAIILPKGEDVPIVFEDSLHITDTNFTYRRVGFTKDDEIIWLGCFWDVPDCEKGDAVSFVPDFKAQYRESAEQMYQAWLRSAETRIALPDESVDLDGDGIEEKVTYRKKIEWRGGADLYIHKSAVITVDGVEFDLEEIAETLDISHMDYFFRLVSLDAKGVQIAIDSWDNRFIFTYKNGMLSCAGSELSAYGWEVIGREENGGVILSTTCDVTCLQLCSAGFVFSYSNGKLTEKKQDYYPLYCRNTITAKEDFELWKKPGEKDSFSVKAGSSIQLIECNAAGDWLRVEDKESGRQGWLQMSSMTGCILPDGRIVEGEDLFDGLWFGS